MLFHAGKWNADDTDWADGSGFIISENQYGPCYLGSAFNPASACYFTQEKGNADDADLADGHGSFISGNQYDPCHLSFILNHHLRSMKTHEKLLSNQLPKACPGLVKFPN